jgi:hypothetical protein
MMELERDSNLLASTLASTFLWRSKPTQERVWLQRLKKVSWLQAFSTRILKPSLSEGFTEKLISFLPDSHASRLVRPDSEGQTMTQDTSGHSSVTELMLADLPLFCSKMLTELSQHDLEGMTGQTQRERPFCSMSLENWKDWVTEQRQDASRRQKLVHHTNASDGLSWPTATTRDHKDGTAESCRNVPSNGLLGREIHKHSGHPDRDSHSLNGNLQGFADWRTPSASEAGAKVETLYTKDGEPARPGQRAYRQQPDGRLVLQSQTINQQVEMIERQSSAQWPTASTSDAEGGPQPLIHFDGQSFKCEKVNKPGSMYGAKLRDAAETHEKNWPTPATRDVSGISGSGRQERKGNPLDTLPNAVILGQEQWATPSCTTTGGPTGLGGGSGNKAKMNALGDEGRAMCTAKLNPRWVETLMGLEPGTVSIEPCTPTTCTNRTDELRMLGNGVVPQTCAVAVRVLMDRLNSFNKSQQRMNNDQR